MDTPNLFGKAWEPEDFNDDSLSRALEKMAHSDLSRIFYSIVREALEKESIVPESGLFGNGKPIPTRTIRKIRIRRLSSQN